MPKRPPFTSETCFAVLADEDGVWDRYVENPGIFGRLFNETLRVHGPPQRLFRVATRDTKVGDALIRRGDWVAVFFGAANHDPGGISGAATGSTSIVTISIGR